MIRILIGGSPCTYWSVSQKKNREVEAEGVGWELFKNYLIAKEKFKPDYFLYENNKSAAEVIKQQIARELQIGVDSAVRLTYINSALVSAQNRQRFYVTNFNNISQPEDKNIILDNILCNYNPTLEAKCAAQRGRYNEFGKIKQQFEVRLDGKTNTLTTVAKDNNIVEKIGNNTHKCEFLNEIPIKALCSADNKLYNIYHVKNNIITVEENRKYKIKLDDGYYIFRKLTLVEAARLQTIPDNYCQSISPSQGYKCFGNGWTAEVIIHILKHMNIPLNEEICILSMYDGIGTGRYCFDKIGYKNIKYYATEIDKHAKTVALSNYPDIIELGNAYQVREENWILK